MNKMIIHWCGGAGLNIARAVNDELASLGKGFCSIHPKYIDTSANNIGELSKDDLWKIEALGYSDKDMDGSGGY